jgi:exodeoxyribonuclease-3
MFNDEPENYTWWSYRGGARPRNKGWRLDYHMVTPPLEDRVRRAAILSEAVHSDHCPVLVEIEK